MEDSKIIDKLNTLIKEGIDLRDTLLNADLSSYIKPTIIHNRSHYQMAEKWKISAANILSLKFGGDSYYFKKFEDAINTEYKTGSRYCKENVAKALGVLEAIKDAIENGLTEDLFYQREVILFGDLLEQANEFIKKNLDLAATIYGRVVLETVVKEFAGKRNIVKKGFDETIVALKKSGIISQPLEHSLRANYAIGSAATHNKEDFEKISKQDIKNFLDFIRDKVLTL